jgi:hypothetical protein
MSKLPGKTVPVSPCRQLVVDLLHFCKQVPAATVERPMELARVVAARQACPYRPSWSAIFLKALSIVAARRSELRRCFMPFPWAHFYEHPINIGNFTIEREHDDENVVFFVQVRRPEQRSLESLNRLIQTCKERPVESVKFFRRALRMSKVPWPFRRLSWWVSLNLFGKLRCHNYGTFSITSVSSAGGGVFAMPTLLTASLHYGLFDKNGMLPMRITFDHRVLDGGFVARAMVELEQVLLTDILHELLGNSALKAA